MDNSFLFSTLLRLKKLFNIESPDISETVVSKKSRNISFGIIYSKKQKDFFINAINNLLDDPNINRTIFFTIDDIDFTNGVVKGFKLTNKKIEYVQTQIPSHIYNTAVHVKPTSIKTMRQLRIMDSVKIINPINSFYQSIIFDMISSFSGSESFLLPYSQLHPSNLLSFLNDFGSVFILPERSSWHHKGLIINKNPEKGKDNYIINMGINEQSYEESILYNTIKKITGCKRYFIMKAPETLQWNDSPLEVQAFVQKGTSERWSLSNLIVKKDIFATGSIHNNTYDNFKSVLLNISSKDIANLEQKLTDLSLNICTYLSHFIPNIASITLDFLVDTDNNPYLIFMSGWNSNLQLYNFNQKDYWEVYIKNIFNYLQLQKSLYEKVV